MNGKRNPNQEAPMAGYTHRVSYSVRRASGILAGLVLPVTFRTTADAVALHVRDAEAHPELVGEVLVERLEPQA
jgi:hypothetical protein